MNCKIFMLLFFAAFLFLGGSTAALAGDYWAHGRGGFEHRFSYHDRFYGDRHAYRWHNRGGRGYHHDWPYYREYQGPYSPFVEHYYYPYPRYGGPFFGGTFLLPGWGVVFGGQGRW
jgi:hypothetical protein